MRSVALTLLVLVVSACLSAGPVHDAPRVPASEHVHVSTYALSILLTPPERDAVMTALRAWTESTAGLQQFDVTDWYSADIRVVPLRSRVEFITIASYPRSDWFILAGCWTEADQTAYLLAQSPLDLDMFAAVAAHEIGHALKLYHDSPTYHIQSDVTVSLMHSSTQEFPRGGIAHGIPIADVIEWNRVRSAPTLMSHR